MYTNMADGLGKCVLFTSQILFVIFTCSVSYAASSSSSRVICRNNTFSDDENVCESYKQTSEGFICERNCCDGWTRDNNATCTKRLPSDYQKPIFLNCPKLGEQVRVEIRSSQNFGQLYKRMFYAHDWKDDPLQVGLSKTNFSHCKCSFPYENVTAYSEEDTYGNRAVCNFSVIIVDSHKPKIENCPEDQQRTDKDVIIWNSPEVGDNVGVQFLLHPDKLNNSIFSAGRYHLFYNATDYSRNTASCSFTIVVTSLEFVCDCDNSSTAPYLVSTIVGAFLIVLIVLGLAVFGIFRRHQRSSQQQQQQQPNQQLHSNHQTTSANDAFPVHQSTYDNFYQMYDVNPPPYDVITYDKPPDYSPPLDPPPYSESGSNDFSNYSFVSSSNRQNINNIPSLLNTQTVVALSSSQSESSYPTLSLTRQSNPTSTETVV